MQYLVSSIALFFAFIYGAAFGLEWTQYRSIVDFLHKWEALTAGLVAFLGAVLTIHAMRRKSDEEQKRKQRAALFPLGDALSEVCHYSRQGMSHLINLDGSQSSFNEEIPRAHFEALKDIAEWFEGDESKAAGVIGPKYQLCRARVRGDVGRNHSNYRKEVICTFAELHALAGRLFDLSRNIDEPIIIGDVSRQEIDEACFDAGLGLFQWRSRADVQDFLNQRYGSRGQEK